MIRLPRKCVEVLQPNGKTTVRKYVTALEVPLMRAKWYHAAEKTHLATPVAHAPGEAAENYWYDFPSVEGEMARLKTLYTTKEQPIFDKIYPSDEDFLAAAERLIEDHVANPVLPESARPAEAPPVLLEMLKGTGDFGGITHEAIALSIASTGLLSPADVAEASLSFLCKAHLLVPETASVVRDAARAYLKAAPKTTAEAAINAEKAKTAAKA